MDNSSELDAAGLFDARYLAFLETVCPLRPSLHRYCSREIGIRAALGAGPRRIVMAILSHAFAQLGVGVVVGAPGAVFLDDQVAKQGGLTLLAGVVALVLVGRRAPRVHRAREARTRDPADGGIEGGRVGTRVTRTLASVCGRMHIVT